MNKRHFNIVYIVKTRCNVILDN